jgi:FlaA1/EpsC-like NDP-sugar epimerase
LGRFSREQVKPAVRGFLTGDRELLRVVLVTSDLSSGEALARQMHHLPTLRCRITGFLHPDPEYTGSKISGIPVLGTPRDVPSIIGKADELLV